MTEKFYIVTDEKLLKELEDYTRERKKINEFIKDFFQENGISGEIYYINGSGFINVPFNESTKENINLFVEDNEENNKRFGKSLLKHRRFDDKFLRRFRKGCALLKNFQKECIDKKIVINLRSPSFGEYFKEFQYGGCSTTCFFYKDKYYLRISSIKRDSITPLHKTFHEIKGSEFYNAYEEAEEHEENE